MRVQGFVSKEWTLYEFKTTYKMGWERVLFLAKAVYPHLKNHEIKVSKALETPADILPIKDEKELMDIPEGSFLEIRGFNTIYDGAPFVFQIYNQADLVRMFLPTDYLNTLKASETEFLDDEGKKHTFDKFMDSLEVNASIMQGEMYGAKNATKAAFDMVKEALLRKNNFASEGEKMMLRVNGCEFDLTDICNKVVEVWKEVQKEKE